MLDCKFKDKCDVINELEELVKLQSEALNKARKRIMDYEAKETYANHRKVNKKYEL